MLSMSNKKVNVTNPKLPKHSRGAPGTSPWPGIYRTYYQLSQYYRTPESDWGDLRRLHDISGGGLQHGKPQLPIYLYDILGSSYT